MILIICDAFDTHASEVEKHLLLNKQVFFRLNLDVESLRRTHLHFDGNNWTIEQENKTISSTQITAVWARRLTVSLTLEQQTEEEESEFKLWRSEWNRSLYGFYSYIRNIFWMNPIQQSSIVDNKFYQMRLASSIGFNIPEFINSNKRDDLIKFASTKGAVAIKFMSQDMYKMPDGSFNGIYVNKITANDISTFQDYEENPITLQSYVDKDFEVRYTFVDGEHFVCKIDSQKSKVSNIDWRRYDVSNTPHFKIKPPEDIYSLVNKMMIQSGLYYGAFDFIVDKDGRWWYLEVNTSGQWLWIEDLVGLPISAKVASSLSIRSRRVL